MLYDYPGYRDCRSFCNLDLTILPDGIEKLRTDLLAPSPLQDAD